ncbi:MAG TPA: hypothetical protein VKQ32_15105 [Polyangia bacterium]|nr:hypothetical protein [Polyangia bacterium]
MRAAIWIALLAVELVGCATLRLNGCRKLASCGEAAAYACSDEAICADHDGNTLHADRTTSSHDPCRICRGGLD